jgi:hypothetical protein
LAVRWLEATVWTSSSSVTKTLPASTAKRSAPASRPSGRPNSAAPGTAATVQMPATMIAPATILPARQAATTANRSYFTT